jgi:hypothetical protein
MAAPAEHTAGTASPGFTGCIYDKKMLDYNFFLLTGVVCTRVAKGGSAPDCTVLYVTLYFTLLRVASGLSK